MFILIMNIKIVIGGFALLALGVLAIATSSMAIECYNHDKTYKAAKEDLEPKPEGSLKFQLGKSLEDILYDWWSDVFVNHSDLDTETSISDLVDRIELFLPKSQSAAGSQSFDSELLVEGWNNCLSIIKGKLR